MKKFYSLIAAALVGTMVASAANVLQQKLQKSQTGFIHPDLEIVKTDVKSPLHHALKAQSRAEEDPKDPTTFTQQIYYDYFFNWYGPNGEQLKKFRYLQSSNEAEIIQNDDNTYSINNFAGNDFVSVPVKVSEDGSLMFNLGDVVGELPQYNYTLVLASIDDDGNVIFEGQMNIDAYLNAWVVEDFLGLFALDSKSGKELGWWNLLVDVYLIQPNARLTYSVEIIDDETGEVETIDVDNMVYYDERPADQNDKDNPWPYYWISNVMPFNQGVGVKFFFDTEYGDDYLLAMDQIAYPSEQYAEGQYTGDFYLNSVVENYAIPSVFASYTSDGIAWPETHPELGEANYWMVYSSQSEYYFNVFTKANLELDVEPSSINDVNIDTDSNEAPVYYNIQGMRVENPQAGQLIIKKQGNKATKLVIR